MKYYTEAERQSPRTSRDYAVKVSEVPLWAIPALVKILDDKIEELDIEGWGKVAAVNLKYTTMSFSEDKDAQHDALWYFMDEELELPAEGNLLKTRKLPSIAELEAERKAKKEQA